MKMNLNELKHAIGFSVLESNLLKGRCHDSIEFYDMNGLVLKGSGFYYRGDINLSCNNFSSFRNFPSVILGNLDLSNNILSDFKGSPSFVEGSINISFNRIKSLKNMPNTKTLYCVANKLQNLEGLSSITNDLDVAQCNIKTIKHIKGRKFTSLHLRRNCIEDLHLLKTIESPILEVQKNPIQKINSKDSNLIKLFNFLKIDYEITESSGLEDL